MAREGKAKVLTESEFKRLLVIAKNGKHAHSKCCHDYCSYVWVFAPKNSFLIIKDIVTQIFNNCWMKLT